MSKFRKASGIIFWASIIWLIFAGLILLTLWPWHPTSEIGWILFIVLAPPFYFIGELFFDWVWSTRSGGFASKHPSPVMRVTLGVFMLLLIISIIIFAGNFLIKRSAHEDKKTMDTDSHKI